jgi:hypothetical protein
MIDFFDKSWPISKFKENKIKENYLLVLAEIMNETLAHAAGKCLICSEDLGYLKYNIRI